MRGKSSSSSSSRVKAMEVVERPSKSKEEPHLSGAYIRSLVKHLSSSRPKDQTMNPKSPDSTLEEAQPLQSPPPPPPPTHPPKKQVRRRLHTSRPYQERLLNMAEARREIVTALKFHRASMKQANEQQHQQQPPPPSPNPTPNIYQQSQPTFSNPSFTPFTYPSLPWSYTTPAPLPDIPDNLNLPLPNTPLGLNLNFQGFHNIDTPLYNSNTIKDPPILLLSPHSSSSSSYSYSSPPVYGVKALEAQTMPLGTCDLNIDLGDQKLHLAMDEKEMAEIRSIGEKHDIEWNDMVNFVTSAWWSKFLETMEVEDSMEGHGFQAFDEAIEIPAWLKDGSGGDGDASHLLMQHLDDYCLQDASLPCLDIGEIEWLDGDWLS